MSAKHWPAYWSTVDGKPVCEITEEGNGAVCEVYNSPTAEADARLIAAAPEMLALLRELEWAGGDASGSSCCPACGAAPAVSQASDAHAPGCRLHALLARIDGKAG